jgi:ACT domain-containing protein
MKWYVREERIDGAVRAVITVLGSDKVGIIAKVATFLAEHDINILDISQTTMQNIFTMIMLTDISENKMKFTQLVDELEQLGKGMGVVIRTQHEEIFNSMHEV